MGCFSWLCKECGKPINSSSFRGQLCTLILIKNGEVIEKMTGEYDSYGKVFDENGKSIEWYMPWDEVVDLMFDSDTKNGILAFHQRCYNSVRDMLKEPLERSEDDDNQGWGNFIPQKVPFKGGLKYN